jgi:cell division topological specificity factor
MNLLNLFGRRATAPVARDRLQILLAHERTIAGGRRGTLWSTAPFPMRTSS